jgi:hypothetical protein
MRALDLGNGNGDVASLLGRRITWAVIAVPGCTAQSQYQSPSLGPNIHLTGRADRLGAEGLFTRRPPTLALATLGPGLTDWLLRTPGAWGPDPRAASGRVLSEPPACVTANRSGGGERGVIQSTEERQLAIRPRSAECSGAMARRSQPPRSAAGPDAKSASTGHKASSRSKASKRHQGSEAPAWSVFDGRQGQSMHRPAWPS